MVRETSSADSVLSGAATFPQPEDVTRGTDELEVGFTLTDVSVVVSDDESLHATANIANAMTSPRERGRTRTDCPARACPRHRAPPASSNVPDRANERRAATSFPH